MRRIVVFIVVCVLIAGLNLPSVAQNLVQSKIKQGSSHKIVLQGGIQKRVPRTPSEVQAYLIAMKKIMKEYEVLSNKLVGILISGTNTSETATKARNEWIRLANKIDSIAPPAELKMSHSRLANSLRNSSKFVVSIGGAPASQKNQILMNMMPIVSDLSQSALYYNQGVNAVIAKHGLNPSLSPLGPQGELSGSTSTMGNMGSLGALGALLGGSSGINMNQLQNLQNLNK